MNEDLSDILRDVREDPYHLDGNALGGVLRDIFGREVTGGEAACADCGASSPVGALMVYNRSPAQVLSCPGCGAVLMVLAHFPGAYRLTFERLRALQIPDNPAS